MSGNGQSSANWSRTNRWARLALDRAQAPLRVCSGGSGINTTKHTRAFLPAQSSSTTPGTHLAEAHAWPRARASVRGSRCGWSGCTQAQSVGKGSRNHTSSSEDCPGLYPLAGVSVAHSAREPQACDKLTLPGHLPVPVAGVTGNALVQVPVGQRLLLIENKFLQFHLHLCAGHSTWCRADTWVRPSSGKGALREAQGATSRKGWRWQSVLWVMPRGIAEGLSPTQSS